MAVSRSSSFKHSAIRYVLPVFVMTSFSRSGVYSLQRSRLQWKHSLLWGWHVKG